LRVLHLIESLGLGGAERRLVSDLTWLDRARTEHRVAYLTPADALRAEVASLGVSVEWLGMRTLRDWRPGVSRLLALLRAWRPDIVHTQVFGADVYGRTCAALAGTPAIVSTVQTLPYDPALAALYSRKRRLAQRITRHFCHRFIAVSEAVAQSLRREVGVAASRITLIPNSVDTARFAPQPDVRQAVREALGCAEDDFIILAVGRLIPDKDHASVMRAAAALRTHLPRARWLIAGEGPARPALERLADDLQLNGCLRLLGARRDVEQLYQAADVFVLPSLREGMPVSLLEAMASGVPAIASRLPQHEEVVTDGATGQLVPRQQPEALAQGVLAVAQAPERFRGMAREGRAAIAARYSAQAAARALQALYDELLARGGRP
jgi:glycosyltransferase involved in cell wall biosynthesis